MQKPCLKKMMILILILGFSISGLTQNEKNIDKTFDSKDEIRLKLVLGECSIEKSSDNRIHVNLVYWYEDDIFEPIFREQGTRLYLEEDFHSDRDAGDGYSRWTLQIPDDIEIEFKSATGDLEVKDIKTELEGKSGTGNMELLKVTGEFEVKSGTGSITLQNSKGEFELSSGTGNIRIHDSQARFDVSSGTGNVEAQNIFIDMEASFSSGTGDAEVEDIKGSGYDLSLKSGTGDAELDLNGKSLPGTVEMQCQERSGKIVSDFSFDVEETFYRDNEKYLRKVINRSGNDNRIEIHTGTGKAVLKK